MGNKAKHLSAVSKGTYEMARECGVLRMGVSMAQFRNIMATCGNLWACNEENWWFMRRRYMCEYNDV